VQKTDIFGDEMPTRSWSAEYQYAELLLPAVNDQRSWTQESSGVGTDLWSTSINTQGLYRKTVLKPLQIVV